MDMESTDNELFHKARKLEEAVNKEKDWQNDVDFSEQSEGGKLQKLVSTASKFVTLRS